MANNVYNRYMNYINTIVPNSGDDFIIYDFKDKTTAIDWHISYMLNKTQSMFEWRNLPDSIPQRILELYLQCNGNCCWYKHEGELYVFTGALGGKPNVYYMPTIYTIANPALNLSKNLVINEECVVMPNDTMYLGLLPIFKKYATIFTETELSMHVANINSRILSIISAQDDNTYKSAEKYIDDVINGEIGIISENKFIEGLKTLPYATQGKSFVLDVLVSYMTYMKTSFLAEIGIEGNYQLKKATMINAELEINSAGLLPLVDNMLLMRQEFAKKVNEMFGTDISVEFSSAWKLIHMEEEITADVEHNADSEEITSDVNEEITGDIDERGIEDPTGNGQQDADTLEEFEDERNASEGEGENANGDLSDAEDGNNGNEETDADPLERDNGDMLQHGNDGITININVGDNNSIQTENGENEVIEDEEQIQEA